MKTYKTSEVARCIGIHPNTVRLYEELKHIPKPEIKSNGYRIFTDFYFGQVFDVGKSSEIVVKKFYATGLTSTSASTRYSFKFISISE